MHTEPAEDASWAVVGHGSWRCRVPDTDLRDGKVRRIDAMEESLHNAFVDAEMLVIPNGLDLDK